MRSMFWAVSTCAVAAVAVVALLTGVQARDEKSTLELQVTVLKSELHSAELARNVTAQIAAACFAMKEPKK